jgi:two-component system, NarL family, nitrate/nitrite response regulator NarL
MLDPATEGRGRGRTRSSLRLVTATAHEAVASSEEVDSHDGNRPIRVFLVADVCVYRELLVEALEEQESLEVAGRTPGDIASMAIGMTEPAVVLLDTSSGSGSARVQALAAAVPAAKIVAVGIPDDELTLLELVEAGVSGYVTAEQPLDELVEAVEAAANGELRCSPRVSAALAERVAALKAEGSHGSDAGMLTRRQREIAALIAQGLSNKQIATRLSIQRATVKNHVHNILSKLGVSHRDEVAVFVRTSLLMLLTATAGIWASWAAFD